MKILFLAASFPYPPLKGHQVRAYHQLRLLGQTHELTLLCFAEGPIAPQAREKVERFCAQITIVPLRRPQMAANILRNPFSTYPFQTLLYRTPAMTRAVEAQLQRTRFDLLHVQMARMAPYFEALRSAPRVLDFIDALSLNMARRMRVERGPLRLAAMIEHTRLRRYERWLCTAFEQATVVSPVDRQAIGAFSNLHVNAVGVDLDTLPFVRVGRERRTIIFTGNMGYFPNANAVRWFAREVLPRVKARVPDVRFYIVGAHPGSDVRQLAGDPAITVTGYVPDIQAQLTAATVAVAPLQAGSGVQNKVLEAMATGTPLVVTPYAIGGIDALPDEHVLLAESAERFADQVVRLLGDQGLQQRLADRAYELIRSRYTWEQSIAQLDRIYEQARAGKTPPARRRAASIP